MVGDRDSGGQNAPPDPSDAVALAVHELAEALSAVGNFVTAATRLSAEGTIAGDELRNALAGASSQSARAGIAAHRLFRLLIPGWADPG
jgi:hypothetical protein